MINSSFVLSKTTSDISLTTCVGGYPKNLKELEEKYSSVLDFESITPQIVEEIGNEMIRLTTEKQKKSINTLNKQFQNSIMNYFMECYVSELLINEYNAEFKRDIFKILISKMEKQEGSCLKKRYITILNYYLDEIECHNKVGNYVELLLNVIKEEITAEKDTVDYQTQYRKKLTALLILEHMLHSDRKTKFTDFYSLWSHVFSFCPLSRKKSQSVAQLQKNSDDSSDQCLNQKRFSNAQDTPLNKKRKTVSTAPDSPTSLPQKISIDFKESKQISKEVSNKNEEAKSQNSFVANTINLNVNLPQNYTIPYFSESSSSIYPQASFLIPNQQVFSNYLQPNANSTNVQLGQLIQQSQMILFPSQQLQYLQQYQYLQQQQQQQQQQQAIQILQQPFNQLSQLQQIQSNQSCFVLNNNNQTNLNSLSFYQPNKVLIIDPFTSIYPKQN